MIYAIDIDGTIACEDNLPGVAPWEVYFSTLKPMPGAVEAMRDLHFAGHRILLHSAREERSRAITVRWLEEHGIPFDELHLGKPFADRYIDNKGYEFRSWEQTLGDL